MNDSITYLHNMTPQQLEDIISKNVKIQLEDFFRNIKLKKPEELLTRKETSQLLKINITTLWNWSRKGILKSYRIGNRIYYKRDDIEEALIRIPS